MAKILDLPHEQLFEQQSVPTAAIGGLFVPNDHSIDFQHLGSLQAEILNYAEMLDEPSTELKDCLQTGIQEAVDKLKEGLVGAVAVADLTIATTSAPLAHETPLKAFRQQYATDTGFRIPQGTVTAVSALAFSASEGGNYRPQVDMRVRTTADRPTTIFDRAGGLREVPSDGTWFRFPLAKTYFSVG